MNSVSVGMVVSSWGQPRGLGRLEAVEPDGHGLMRQEGERAGYAAAGIGSGAPAASPSSAIGPLSGGPAWLFA